MTVNDFPVGTYVQSIVSGITGTVVGIVKNQYHTAELLLVVESYTYLGDSSTLKAGRSSVHPDNLIKL